jgi:hypothetical protein
MQAARILFRAAFFGDALRTAMFCQLTARPNG